MTLAITDDKFQMPTEAVEAGLLASIAGDMNKWLEVSAFTSDDFVAHKAVFMWVGQYLTQYGSLPSNSLINSKFELHAPIGDYQYWISEFRRYALARRVLEALQEGYSKIADPNAALSLLLDKLSILRSQQTNHIQATDSSASERLERFDYRTEAIFRNKEMLGLPTGMKLIDDTLIGWTPGSLVGVYARPGVGKTWWLMWQGLQTWMNGGTVLALAPEMPANMLNLRIDTIAAKMLGHPIDYGKLLTGDPSIRANYDLVTQILGQSQRWWTYSSVNDRSIGLGDIAALIRQHQPSIVLIDGISLLKSESKGQTWEQMKDLCYGVKNLGTVYEIPILMTHQAVNSARGRRTEITQVGRGDDFIMPSLNDAAFGDSFVQACSDVLTFCAEPSTKHIIWYSLRKFRERGFKQEVPSRMALVTDFGTGAIFDLSEFGYNPEAVGQEMRRLLGVS